MRSIAFTAALVVGLLAIHGSTRAAFVVVDNFESHSLGASVGGVNGWTLSQGTGNVVADPAGGANQVLSASQATNTAVHLYKGLTLPNANTGTLYFRARVTEPVAVGSASDISIGMADVAAPLLSGTGSGFAAYESQIGFVNVASGAVIPGEIRPRDAGTSPNAATLGHSTWYDVWAVIDNATDLQKFYVQGGAFATQTQLSVAGQTMFTFRNTTGDGVDSNTTPVANDLLSLFIRAGGSHRGPIFIDDIYFDEAAANLTNPTVIPEPATIALAALAGLMAAATARRRKA
jgi:hypothetical protein